MVLFNTPMCFDFSIHSRFFFFAPAPDPATALPAQNPFPASGFDFASVPFPAKALAPLDSHIPLECPDSSAPLSSKKDLNCLIPEKS